MTEKLGSSESPLADDTTDRLVQDVSEVAREHATDWFSGLEGGGVQVRPVASDRRARCFLHTFELQDGPNRRRFVVKVRHSNPALRRLDRFPDRPILTPERTMSDQDTARREYDGLRALEETFGPLADARFGVLRPLAWLPQHAAIVMDLVAEPTLRRHVLSAARPRRRGARPVPDVMWQNAGAWLRVFQDHLSRPELPPRLESAEEVAALYRRYADFLLGRLGRGAALTQLRDHADDIVADALPDALPLRPGHGDLVTNNMFADPAGRITVFDPLIRWRVPRYQDLATLTVGLRVLPARSATLGLAIPGAELDHYEEAMLGGYHGAESTPYPEVRALQLLVLLDRWAATVSKQVQGGRIRRGLHTTRVTAGSQHYRREAGRLLTLLGR